MATSSILKNIVIRDNKSAKNFIRTLERASKKAGKDVVVSKRHNDVKGNDIKEMFREM